MRKEFTAAIPLIFMCAIIILFVSMFLTDAKAGETKREARVVVEHWPPWQIAYDDDKKKVTGGIAVELVKELMNRVEIKEKLVYAPWKRALIMIDEGKADVILNLSKTPERSIYMVFTDPVYIEPYKLVYSTDKFPEFQWREWKDLKPYTIGITRGYNYGPGWDKAVKENQYRLKESVSDEQSIKRLLLGRLDLVPLIFSSGIGIIKDIEGGEKLRTANKPIYESAFHFGISKKSFLAQKLPEINKALQRMKADGAYKKILKDLYIEPNPSQ